MSDLRVDALEDELAESRAEVARLQKALDICSVVHGHNVKLKSDRDALRSALKDAHAGLLAALTSIQSVRDGEWGALPIAAVARLNEASMFCGLKAKIVEAAVREGGGT